LSELRKSDDSLGKPKEGVVNAGYYSDENVRAFKEEGIEPYIATGLTPHIFLW
jgi:hypothetical protein